MRQALEPVIERVVDALKTKLGDRLHSCCLYGSAVRGNVVEGVSDLNLLVVLTESNAGSHEAVGAALADFPQVDPFVLGRRGFERSVRAFAPKFASIQRHYRVLYGADPLAGIAIDPDFERFLCEQALRNLRLRLIFSFVTRARHNGYDRFVIAHVTALFTQIAEVLRLQGQEIPTDFAARIPIFEKAYAIDGAVLRELLALKAEARRLSAEETVRLHERLFPVVDAVLVWIEANWPA